MPVRLALFPLSTVLFPHLLLPLHVFEERYRRMVRDLLELPEQDRRFGVVAIREGREVGTHGVRSLHPVGCVARLRRVEPYDDGRFDLVSSGTQRFRLRAVDDGLPYLRAEVEPLPEPPGDVPEALAPGVRTLFAAYREALGGSPDTSDSDLPADPERLSYAVAAAAVLDLREKQRLLEAPDTAARLRAEQRLLRRETALLGRLRSVPGVELSRLPASPN